MSDAADHSRSRIATILWPVALVAAVHLLTTPGQWLLTDQKEYILVADRLIERGTLHLAEPGEPPRPELPWAAPARAGGPQRSRLLPLTSVALAPFLLADRALGSSRLPADRPLTHLQWHVFVLAGLGLMGAALALRRASPAAIASAVVLTGLSWPVWQVSRRGGTEAVFILLVALFLLGQARADAGERGRGPVLMAIACALLPWGNPTGAVLGAALLAGALAECAWTRRSPRPLAAPLAAWAASGAVLVIVWNHLYQGHWLMGGYAPHLAAPNSVVDAASLSHGIRLHLEAIALDAGPLLAVAAMGVLGVDRRGRGATLVPLSLVSAMLLVFATFPQPEPTRRLAAAWPAWGVAAGRMFPGLRWPPSLRQAALALAAVVGFRGFWLTEGRYHAGPGGLFYPSVTWVRMWIDSAPAWHYLLPCALLAALLVVAAGRTSRLLFADGPAHG